MGKSCAAVASPSQSAALKPSQFVKNVVDCLDGAREGYAEYRGIIKQLPKMIDKLLSVSWTEGLIVLSVYFVYNSFLLYDEAKNLEVNVRSYRDKLERKEEEMKAIGDFIKTTIIPHWEAGNTANLEKDANKLLEMIGRHSAVLQELTQAIRQDIKTGGSQQRLSTFVAVCGFVLCLGSVAVRPAPNVANPPSSGVSQYLCVAAIGAAGYCWFSCSSLSDTLPELERLEKDATTMGQEITRYQSQLNILKMEAELKSTD